MAVSPAEIRSRVTTAISTELAESGWRESRLHYDLFGKDPDLYLPQSFAVGVLDTQFLDDRRRVNTRGGSQDGTVGTRVETTFAVKWAHRCRADAQVDDTDDALAVEPSLVQAVGTMSCIGTTSPIPERITRVAAGDGTMMITITVFRIQHLYAVQSA